MSGPLARACSTCQWFNPTVAGMGECRLNPPSPAMINAYAPALNTLGFWPICATTAWCSQYDWSGK